tara:strand:- start:254 stop:529 length:276 start_codon:yes stop_codon:yes gene_type:complete
MEKPHVFLCYFLLSNNAMCVLSILSRYPEFISEPHLIVLMRFRTHPLKLTWQKLLLCRSKLQHSKYIHARCSLSVLGYHFASSEKYKRVVL